MDKARQAAYDNGEIHYTPNQPCKRGHTSKRYTSTGNCIDCMKNGYQAQGLRNKSRKLISIQGMLKHPATYLRNVELRAHEILDMARDIWLLGSEADRDELTAYLIAKRSMMQVQEFDRPPLNRQGHMSYLDLIGFFKIAEDGKTVTNIRDFDMASSWQSDEGLGPLDCMWMGGYWYDLEKVKKLYEREVTGIRPREQVPGQLPTTMKGIIK